ncbi:MAG: amino acid ABC transporter substrate-binding protein [Rhodospirillaceae bacterium]|jgi:polar amino acid transport system substrate-binding protein|nr:amino acid ABC transporter substrate-binding protein [Rhodospirillaceae bacterium]MBT5245150.1 amino acid ABC transporter substrate-binding protein [Rhodospirillaceae bacterium]MBT7136627.1 amino acid ABC transporter substrate-binding protein [Rhodospirillaceae bacterium]
MRHLIRNGLLALIGFAFVSVASAQTSPTIDSIKKEGVIRIAMADSPPSQAKNPATNEWEGFNVEMANDLAKVLGVKLEIVDATWATLIPGLLAKQYDLCMVDMFATPERALAVVFTDSYNTLGYSFLVRADSKFKTWRDLNASGVTIATLSGTSGEPFVQTRMPKAEMKSMVSDNNYAPHMEVMNGRADAHITDHINNLLFIKNNASANLRTVPEDKPLLNATGLAYATRPGDPHFHAFLNTWISYLRDSGQLEELRLKYFEY